MTNASARRRTRESRVARIALNEIKSSNERQTTTRRASARASAIGDSARASSDANPGEDDATRRDARGARDAGSRARGMRVE